MATDVPARLADIEELGDGTDVDRLAAPGLVAVAAQQVDLLGHLCSRCSLRQPTVAPFGGAADGGIGGSADPDRRTGPLYRPGPDAEPVERPPLAFVDGELVGQR